MTIGFETHDHAKCVTSGLAAAEAECKEKGLQFTAVRRRTLEILLQAHKAMGAYEVLDQLRDDGLGGQPPVAYRALDFLVKNGFVHRIERLNAFIACAHPGRRHAPCFLICTKCETVVEAPGQPIAQALGVAAQDMGFAIKKVAIEAEGLCPRCLDHAA
ncbi:MAG: transcriptional repressor [Pelagimonas sp.]|jgi:Fur family zinc uptake transcriptional regulator|nr:transcriptional repressor [Pelagimonas sp.]